MHTYNHQQSTSQALAIQLYTHKTMNPPTNAQLSTSHSRACHEQKFAPLHCWRANMRLPATISLIELTEITSKTRADQSYTDDYEYITTLLYATFFFFLY